MINLDQRAPGTRQYVMKKRGVFKTTVSRRKEFKPTPEAIAEIDFCGTPSSPTHESEKGLALVLFSARNREK